MRLVMLERLAHPSSSAEPLNERREIAVRGNQVESVELFGVKQVHGIDHQRHVSGVLALHQIEGLHWLDGILVQHLDPSGETGLGPVAIGAPDVDHTMVGKFGENEVDLCGRGVIGINEQGDAVGMGGVHGFRLMVG
jgi:hypothetical protein